ncbi:MAG: hypothetical protein AAFR68_04130 [Pseudomonadota bacterium]
MARNEDIDLGIEWVLLTNSAVASVVAVNKGPNIALLMATNGTNPPSNNDEDGIPIDPRIGVLTLTLSEMFPGVSGADRLYGRAQGGTTKIFVSHA